MNFINNLTDDLLNGTHDLPCPNYKCILPTWLPAM